MKRIAVLTSGGDAPGMNPAIRAVVRYGLYYGMEIYGIKRGYEGMIDGRFELLDRSSVHDILHKGGTILKSARSTRFLEREWREVAYDNLRKYEIDGLVVIGGNGSLTGAKVLYEESGIPVIGIPGTIDNDLGYTERTIGFDTAVTTVLDAISKIRDTSGSHDRSTVIEVMGRNCGDIALYAGVTGGADLVLIPEVDTSIEEICEKVNIGRKSGKQHGIIIRAEGFPIGTQELIDILKERIDFELRPVVLSYLQRGGIPTFPDRLFATECGVLAVELLRDGIYNRAIGQVGGRTVHVDLAKALESKSTLRESVLRGIEILSM